MTDGVYTSLAGHGLFATLVDMLASGPKNSQESVAVVRSEQALQDSASAAGVRATWQENVVAPEAMASATKTLLDNGRPVLLVPAWGRRRLESSRCEATSLQGGIQSSVVKGRLDLQEEILLDVAAPDFDAQLFVLLPATSVKARRAEQFRAALAAQWDVTDVVDLPRSLPGIHPSLECVLLGLRPLGHGEHVIRFFDASDTKPADHPAIVADFARLRKMKGGQTDFGYAFRGKIDAGDSLAHGLRDPKLQEARDDLGNFGRTAMLDELFEVRRGPRTSDRCSPDTPGAARVVSGSDLLGDAFITEQGNHRWATVDPRYLLQGNDLLIPVMSSGTNGRGFRVVTFPEEAGPAVAGPTVLVLRPREYFPTEIVDFAVAYLRSPAAKRLYVRFSQDSSLRGASRLGPDFGQLTLPVPDDEILSALRNLRKAQSNFLEWADEAAAVIDSIFEYPSVKEARPRIIEAGRTVRWRSREARNLDDPDFAVRRAFPYPVAHRWRVMEASLSGTSTPGEGYASILDAAEALLAFLAQVVLVLAQAADIEVKSKDSIQRKLRAGYGPGMGDWAAVLQETTAKHFAEAQGALADIRGMFQRPEVEAARARLSGRRNDEAHNRRVEAVDMKDAIQAALNDLRTLTRSAKFLVDMPLLHVTDTSWDSFDRKATVTFREMAGDHWVVKSGKTLVPSNEIESDSLYFVDPEGHWHLLRPYLVVRDCPQCRTISTFHVDAVTKAGEVRLKSLENGHTLLENREFEALARVGMY